MISGKIKLVVMGIATLVVCIGLVWEIIAIRNMRRAVITPDEIDNRTLQRAVQTWQERTEFNLKGAERAASPSAEERSP
jgi:hypothetical protein